MAQGADVFLGIFDHPRAPANQHVSELRPVLFVVIDDDGDAGIFGDIAHPLQPQALLALGFLVDREIYSLAVEPVAERNVVRRAKGVGGRQMCDARARDKLVHVRFGKSSGGIIGRGSDRFRFRHRFSIRNLFRRSSAPRAARASDSSPESAAADASAAVASAFAP